MREKRPSGSEAVSVIKDRFSAVRGPKDRMVRRGCDSMAFRRPKTKAPVAHPGGYIGVVAGAQTPTQQCGSAKKYKGSVGARNKKKRTAATRQSGHRRTRPKGMGPKSAALARLDRRTQRFQLLAGVEPRGLGRRPDSSLGHLFPLLRAGSGRLQDSDGERSNGGRWRTREGRQAALEGTLPWCWR